MWIRLAARLRAWWHRRELQATVDEELAFHVEMERAAHEGDGLSSDAARRQALADLGGTAHVRADILEVRTPRLVALAERVRLDVRYAGRTFARTPLSITSVVVVLACAIGLNTAVFSAIDALFFAPLPVPSPSTVVYVTGPARSFVDYAVFKNRAHAAVVSVSPTESRVMPLTSPDVHLFGHGEWVNATYFETLGLRPELGRFFVPSEDDPRNVDRAVVISDDLWRGRFGADPSVVGRPVQLDGTDCSIIGVAPPGFRGVSLPWEPSEFWATYAQQISGLSLSTRSVSFVARLAPGVSAATVAPMVADRPGQQNPAPGHTFTTYIIRPAIGPLAPQDITQGLGFVRALADAVAAMALVVMLIAASNVVGILLARGIARSPELAIRQAMGATGRRLVAQLLTESVLLGVAAGLVGLVVAELLLAAYSAVSPVDVALPVTLDLRALVFTLVICSVAGLLVGLAPARQALRANVLSALGAPGAGTPRTVRRRLRYGTVVPQLGLSVALLVMAGAHAKTLFNLEFRPAGYRVDHVLTVELKPPAQTSALSTDDERDAAAKENRGFYTTVSPRLGALPGVSAVALSAGLPSRFRILPGLTWVSRDRLEAHAPAVAAAARTFVSAQFFRVFDIRLLAGRTFDDTRDTPDAPSVVIVNATLARQLAPAGNAVGLLIASPDDRLHNPRHAPKDPNAAPVWSEVVGVVTDTTDGATVVPLVYKAVTQIDDLWMSLNAVAQVSTDPISTSVAMRRAIADVNPNGAWSDVERMADVVARDHYARRLALGLLAFAAGLGMFLASVGLYSAVSYWTAQQARDLGVRATLGATHHDLIALVIWDGAKTVLTALVPGLLLGLAGFRITGRLIQYVIGPVSAPGFDVVLVVVALVVAVTLLACFVPARRAAQADPLVVLRA